jgi:hypothetical protein
MRHGKVSLATAGASPHVTSEIALMNRSAVALAADSAITVRYWEHGKQQTRYNKSANKLFELSCLNPIGMMIFETANCQGVAWELLAKWFRDQTPPAPCVKLEDYAAAFLGYVEGHDVFPPEFQKRQFNSDVRGVAGRIVAELLREDSYKNAVAPADKLAESAKLMQQTEAKIDADEFVGNADQAALDAALADHVAQIEALLTGDPFYSSFAPVINFQMLSRLAIKGLFKLNHTTLNYTGIVIAGFGEKDYFPRLIAYRCYGAILGKLIYVPTKEGVRSTSQENTSEILSFATDDMIRTFIFGISTSGLVELDRDFEQGVNLLEEELKKAGLLDQAANIAGPKEKAKQTFGAEVIRQFVRLNSTPLHRAVSNLSIRELAELSETLVSLESLKERVTRPSEGVSGPIDVAVISKSDGFIWIKRKHYFDPDLNPRFFARKNLK